MALWVGVQLILWRPTAKSSLQELEHQVYQIYTCVHSPQTQCRLEMVLVEEAHDHGTLQVFFCMLEKSSLERNAITASI